MPNAGDPKYFKISKRGQGRLMSVTETRWRILKQGAHLKVSPSYKALQTSYPLGGKETLGSRQEKATMLLDRYKRRRTHVHLHLISDIQTLFIVCDCGPVSQAEHHDI
jgi:hypothetical protein